MNKTLFRLTLMTGVASIAPGMAHAQIAPALQAPTEVVVRANRFDPYRGDSVFSSLDVAQTALRHAASVDDALKTAAQAELFRRSSSLTANPTVQGLGLRAIAPSGAGRALVTLDGIPQNDPFGNWVIWASIPQDAIDHIHVLRGAGGGAYGAGALTGVVDITLTPPQSTRFSSRADIGEAGDHDLSVDGAAGPLGLHYADATWHGDAPVRGSKRGAADVATLGQDRSVLADWQTQACPLGACGQLAVLAGAYDSRRDTGLLGSKAQSRGDQYSLSFTRAPTPDANGLRLQLWHKDSQLANTSVAVATDRSTTTLADNQVATPSTGTGLNWAIRHQTRTVEWEIGVDARLNEGEEREYYKYVAALPTRYRIAGGTTSDAGLYAEGTRNLDALTLTGAVRADIWRAYGGHRSEIDTTSGLNVLNLTPADQSVGIGSARIGLGYAVTPQTALRIAAYSGFRPPSLNELYRPFRVGNDVTEANADLKPERLTGAEAGLHIAASGSLSRLLDADLFYNVVKNPIANVTEGVGPATFPTAGFIPAGGTLRQRQNLGEIDAYGFETHGRYDLNIHLALTASATLTHARVKAPVQPQLNGKRPAEAPESTASVGIESDFAPLVLTADLISEGSTFDDDLNTLPLKPYTRLHLQGDYAVTRHVTLRLQVNNALNEAIQITHGGDGTIGYDNRRAVSIGLVYRQ